MAIELVVEGAADRTRHRLDEVIAVAPEVRALDHADRGHPGAEVRRAFGHQLLRAVGDRLDGVARRAELAVREGLHGDAAARLGLHLGADALDHLHRRMRRGHHVGPAQHDLLRVDVAGSKEQRRHGELHGTAGEKRASECHAAFLLGGGAVCGRLWARRHAVSGGSNLQMPRQTHGVRGSLALTCQTDMSDFAYHSAAQSARRRPAKRAFHRQRFTVALSPSLRTRCARRASPWVARRSATCIARSPTTDALALVRHALRCRHPLFRHRAALRARPVGAADRRGAARRPRAHSFVLSTKVGRLLTPDAQAPSRAARLRRRAAVRPDATTTRATACCARSTTACGGLRLERIDLVYVHDLDRATHGDAIRPRTFARCSTAACRRWRSSSAPA